MFDTYVTIVGNVLTRPEWRRTTQSQTLVANFKVASTARRLDRDSGRWVDGNSLRLRVNCWRKLAEGVSASVMVGDPVIVCGRLYTRDWTDDAGNHRTLYELEAVAVGHDLSRGRGRFLRNRPTTATGAVGGVEAGQRVHDEPTEQVPTVAAPAPPDDRPLDEDFELPGFARIGAGAVTGDSAGPLSGPLRHPAPGDGDIDPEADGLGPIDGPGRDDEPPSSAASDAEPGGQTDQVGDPERAHDLEQIGDPEPVGEAEAGPRRGGRGRQTRRRVPTPV
ncbi:single-stranded DNA-binding protein [Micromonospora sp. WMMA1363]|uniref:single-stranded DNA-binding protein n=1 Tax=Micromonospora sp. WMMA1363 TaxID=3053985 RepID=UPI00259CE77D|nr:single-stranded DNA-binding protein [Micromonospora sp. WMMA1363]MDM4720425.1 single-stranded DNA-binding protein [Micromonospora sp. WMMA1363]